MVEWRGGAVVAVLRLLIAAELYERYLSPTRNNRRSIESLWWLVYVLSSPLLFLPADTAGPLPVIGLFLTRFIVEFVRCERHQTHWLSRAASFSTAGYGNRNRNRSSDDAPPRILAAAPLLATAD